MDKNNDSEDSQITSRKENPVAEIQNEYNWNQHTSSEIFKVPTHFYNKPKRMRPQGDKQC